MTTTKKSSKSRKVDFFKLPFEVFYSGPIDVYLYEFKSNVKVKRFKDVKVVTQDVGQSWGLNFVCSNNKGPELYCCLVEGHSEVDPDWLNFEYEENIEFNSSTNYRVKVNGGKISFIKDDEFEEIEDLYVCSSHSLLKYTIEDIEPDYIILDALNSRVKVNCEGYALDEENNPIESQRIFNPKELDHEKYDTYAFCDLWIAKNAWVNQTLETDFPKDKDLVFS